MAAVCKAVGVLQPVQHARIEMVQDGRPVDVGSRLRKRSAGMEVTSRLSTSASATPNRGRRAISAVEHRSRRHHRGPPAARPCRARHSVSRRGMTAAASLGPGHLRPARGLLRSPVICCPSAVATGARENRAHVCAGKPAVTCPGRVGGGDQLPKKPPHPHKPPIRSVSQVKPQVSAPGGIRTPALLLRSYPGQSAVATSEDPLHGEAS